MAERTTAAELRVAVVFLRVVRGWDQAELAAAAGVSKSSIYRYERGESAPSPQTFQRIVEAVGVPTVTIERLFALIRSVRGALRAPSASDSPERAFQDVESLAAEFADEMFRLMRDAAAHILKGIEEEYGSGEEDDEGAFLEN